MVILSSMFVGESSYVSLSRSFFIYIHFVIIFLEWNEWPSPRGSRWLSFLSLHSLLMWLHSMFDLSWSSFLFICSLFRHHPHHCLWFIPFTSPSYLCLTVIYSMFATLFVSFFTHLIITSICFICLLIDIIFTLGTLRSMAHEIFYTCCISYMMAWVLIIGYLGRVSLHFYYPISLTFIMSCVLRPLWDHGIRCRLRQPLFR